MTVDGDERGGGDWNGSNGGNGDETVDGEEVGGHGEFRRDGGESPNLRDGTGTVEGTILCGPDFEPVSGRVVVEDGWIVGVEEEAVDSTDVVLPAFVNAHTHVGDSVAKEAGERHALPARDDGPGGSREQLLEAADWEETVAAMRQSVRFMWTTGTAAFLDFREGGVRGVRMLYDATEDSEVTGLALGSESTEAIELGDGFGAPSARVGDFTRERRAAREAGKLFGIHAGEYDAGDVNGAFDLDPDFIVHVVHPERVHLERLEDRETPVVVCPRSNLATGAGVPPIRELESRTTVALGTGSVTYNSPSMFREMAFAARLADVPASSVLRMATLAGAEIAGLPCGCIEPDREAKLLVLDGDSDNLSGARSVVRAVVRRAGATDVKAVYL